MWVENIKYQKRNKKIHYKGQAMQKRTSFGRFATDKIRMAILTKQFGDPVRKKVTDTYWASAKPHKDITLKLPTGTITEKPDDN